MDAGGVSCIPGLIARHPNSSIQTLKSSLWCRLHALLGQGGDRILMDLLLECSIFLPVEKNVGNYYQLSGVPISELKSGSVGDDNTLKKTIVVPVNSTKAPNLISENRTPSMITFVRSRMLYSKAALNGKSGVRFGMRHIRQLSFSHRRLLKS